MVREKLLTIKQVAEYLQLDTTTVYSYAQQGKIPAIKVGWNWRFRRKDLEKWLDDNRKKVRRKK